MDAREPNLIRISPFFHHLLVRIARNEKAAFITKAASIQSLRTSDPRTQFFGDPSFSCPKMMNGAPPPPPIWSTL
jgi:hypothetical protein